MLKLIYFTAFISTQVMLTIQLNFCKAYVSSQLQREDCQEYECLIRQIDEAWSGNVVVSLSNRLAIVCKLRSLVPECCHLYNDGFPKQCT